MPGKLLGIPNDIPAVNNQALSLNSLPFKAQNQKDTEIEIKNIIAQED